MPDNVVYLEMNYGLEDFRNTLHERNIEFKTPEIQDSGFGTNSLVIRDPFNNRLRFNEPKK